MPKTREPITSEAAFLGIAATAILATVVIGIYGWVLVWIRDPQEGLYIGAVVIGVPLGIYLAMRFGVWLVSKGVRLD